MKPLSPAMRDRAVDALHYVTQQMSMCIDPADIIADLVLSHSATLRDAHGAYVLRCAGISVSSTTLQPACLLGNWQRSAFRRLHTLSILTEELS